MCVRGEEICDILIRESIEQAGGLETLKLLLPSEVKDLYFLNFAFTHSVVC